jgi:hypothetical protein
LTKILWQFYATRRGHDLAKMLEAGKFKTYGDYATWCDSKDVTPLNEDDFKAHLPKPKPKTKTKTKVKKVLEKPVSAAPKTKRKVSDAVKSKDRASTSRSTKSGDGKD